MSHLAQSCHGKCPSHLVWLPQLCEHGTELWRNKHPVTLPVMCKNDSDVVL